MTEENSTKLRKIKQSFRLYMNGDASRLMREKGVEYKLNWGVPIPTLKAMAVEYGKDYELAIALWKENIRECKILATMIMPPDQMLPEVVDIWMEQTPSQEIAELAAFNLYQHLDYAPILAYEWMASDDDLRQICSYQILARLFMQGQEPNARGINEYLDQVYVALQSGNMGVRRAALASVERFIQLGYVYANMARKALKPLNIDIF